ncbi:zinc-dependent alcohol dehydrogenase family protein [Actinomadura meridiana]|uniref:Zinc-dependent alcohol dehydrogenase family protein n=1 Tax=Actinomadura meridiana TaxID=559626 RepID=A0ABP8CKP6_9ACTN
MALAAVLHAVGDELDLRDDITTVDPGPDQVKVRIKATGVCHTDLSLISGILRQPLPMVIGHEGAGIVTEVGDRVTGVRPGDHVVISWMPDCGECVECVRGTPWLCTTLRNAARTDPRFRLGDGAEAYGMSGTGTWAEELITHHRSVIPIAQDVPFEYAALLGCGIPTGVGAVINVAKVTPGSTVAVVGAGGVGLAVIQGARLAGATTILAIDPNEAKHAVAERFGATHATTPAALEETKERLTGGAGFDYAFEVVGKSVAVNTAWNATRRGGDVIMVGAGATDDIWNVPTSALLFDGKSMKPAMYGGCDLRRDIPRFVDLWRAGRLDIEGLITGRIGFGELNKAVQALADGEVIRQIVQFD